jgi:hypothetical protein
MIMDWNVYKGACNKRLPLFNKLVTIYDLKLLLHWGYSHNMHDQQAAFRFVCIIAFRFHSFSCGLGAQKLKQLQKEKQKEHFTYLMHTILCSTSCQYFESSVWNVRAKVCRKRVSSSKKLAWAGKLPQIDFN